MSGSEARWIFVVGQQRSGSTLLGCLLALATEGFHCGELRQLWDAASSGRLCECGVPVPACPVWSEVTTLARAEVGLAGDTEAAAISRQHITHRDLVRRRLPRPSDQIVALRMATERAIETITGATTLVDTSKLPASLWTASFGERPLDVIHLLRDPRAVAYSHRRAKPDPTRVFDPTPEGRMMVRHSAMNSSIGWLWTLFAAERVLRERVKRRGDAPARNLRYEDLVTDPVAALRPFAPDGASAVAEALVGPSGHGIAGNPARLQWRPVRADDEWQRRLPRVPRLVTSAMSVPFARSYGYTWNPESHG